MFKARPQTKSRRGYQMNTIRVLLLVSASLLLLSGCKSSDKSAACTPPKVEMNAKAQTLWNSTCVTCHGKNGYGDGPAGRNLNPKPRSFADANWQKDTTDDAIMEIIVKGGAAVGKSENMAAYGNLEAVVLEDLVKKIRSFGTCQ